MGPFEQVVDAYRRMASEVRYRPAAPSDGMGNMVMPEAELLLDEEAAAYARRWLAVEDDDGTFDVGTPDVDARPALVFTVEAARLTAGAVFEPAVQLLRMAADELEALATRRRAEEDDLGL
ncbi:hypothetical protein ACNKF0_09430 [Nocardioides sp. T5]|uniref:hypothetical protein n=1 Tax=Nocardioides sp. T5 TaxID=3400182 RepID=UPI003A8B2AA4